MTRGTPHKQVGLRNWILKLLPDRMTADDNTTQRQQSLVELAADHLLDFIETRRDSFSFLRFQNKLSRDAVVSPGEPVTLNVNLDLLIGLAARSIRFFLDGEFLADTERDALGNCMTIVSIDTPGLHRVTFDVVSAGGRTMALDNSQRSMVVQVVDNRPLAAVDANLVLGRSDGELSGLKGLADRGWHVCYADLHHEDRTAIIAETIERLGLPHGAILVHPATDVDFKTLEVDFRQVFAMTAMRRIRAAGVPLVLLVCDSPGMREFVENEGLMTIDLASVNELMRDDFAMAQLSNIVSRFLKHRDESPSPRTWRLDCMTGTVLKGGHRCHVEFDNHRARERIFDMIDRARRTIHCQFYIYKDSRFTDLLAVHLIAKARQGVTVRLMVDALYSTQQLFGLRNKVIEGLAREKNIWVVATDPIRVTDDLEAVLLKQRDHRKIIIIDGELAFVGGRNAGDEYYTGFDEVPILEWTLAETIPWLDAHIEVEGPLVKDLQQAFVDTWLANKGAEIEDRDGLVTPQPMPGRTAARYVFHNGVTDSNGLATYEALFDSARDHIYIINDFPVVMSLASVLREARLRGVRVIFLTGNAQARTMDHRFFKGPLYRELFEYLTKGRFEILLKNDLELREFTTPVLPNIVTVGGCVRPYVHAKVVTVDGEAACIGSANLDATASYWEREASIVVEDPTLVADIEKEIDVMLERSMLIDPASDHWKNEEKYRDIVNLFWPDSIFS